MQPFDDLALETEYSYYKSTVHELIFKSESDSDLQWLGGYFYLKEDNEIKFNVEIPFCCSFIRPLAQSFVQPERTVESQALFAQFDYAVNDRLNLTAGYRYTWDEKEDKNGSTHSTTGYWTNTATTAGGGTWLQIGRNAGTTGIVDVVNGVFTGPTGSGFNDFNVNFNDNDFDMNPGSLNDSDDFKEDN